MVPRLQETRGSQFAHTQHVVGSLFTFPISCTQSTRNLSSREVGKLCLHYYCTHGIRKTQELSFVCEDYWFTISSCKCSANPVETLWKPCYIIGIRCAASCGTLQCYLTLAPTLWIQSVISFCLDQSHKNRPLKQNI